MSARALIIGIDDYPRNPLSAAVADARRFRRALVQHGLVAYKETVLLLTGDPEADGPADWATILGEIKRLYREADDVDRLFFYFAGHGILAYRDPAATQPVTAVLPADLESLDDEGNKLIVVDEICDYLRLVGPAEQFYFIDACRDMPYERNPPRLGSLGFGNRQPLGRRSQSVLFAVSELGRALELGGRGVMTEHLLAALDGRGQALDYSYEDDPPFVVTMESVRNYVAARLAEAGAPEPVLRRQDPPPRPLRQVESPPPRQLAIHVEPDEAFAGTSVKLGFGERYPVVELPPHANHVPVEVEPRRYRLSASSTLGAVSPRHRGVDAREEDEVTVRVGSEGPDPEQPSVTVTAPTAASSQRMLYVRGEASPAEALGRRPPSGWLEALARHRLHAVHALGLEPPYVEERSFGQLSRQLPAGSYRLEFRQEPDLLAATEVFVADASEVSVLAPEAFETYREPPALTLQRFARQVFRDVAGSATYDVAVAIASERGYSGPLSGSLDGVRVTARGQFGSLQSKISAHRMGWGELGHTLISLGEQPFELALEGAALGAIRLASVSAPGHATLVTLRVGAGSELDVSQMLVPRVAVDNDEMVARFQIGQGLYRAGDLLAAPIAGFLEGDLYEGRLDPVLASMALFAATETPPERGNRAFLGRVRELLYDRLELPDARVALAAAGGDADALLDPLLAEGAEPLLDRSAADLAGYALATGRGDHPLVQRRRLVPPRQPWNLIRNWPDGLQVEAPTGMKELQ